MRRGPVSWTQRFDRFATRTFADAAAKYLERYTGKTKGRAVYGLKALNPYLSHMYLIDINNEALEDYKRDRINGLGAFEQPVTSGTVDFEIGLASTILKFATEELEWMSRAPKLRFTNGPRMQPYSLIWL